MEACFSFSVCAKNEGPASLRPWLYKSPITEQLIHDAGQLPETLSWKLKTQPAVAEDVNCELQTADSVLRLYWVCGFQVLYQKKKKKNSFVTGDPFYQ